MTYTLNIQVSESLVKPIIEAKIHAAIAATLKNAEGLIDGIVDRILTTKVNDEGRVSNYQSENRYTMIEQLARGAIKTAADAAVREWVDAQRPQLLESLKKALAKRHGGIADAMAAGLEEALKNSWTFNVTCKFDGRE